MSTEPAATFAEYRARKRRNRRTVHILLEPQLGEDHAALRDAHRLAIAQDMRTNERPRAPAIAAEIAELEERIKASRAPFIFEALPRLEYDKLLDDHPPREGDEDDKRLGFNADEFPPALFAACAVADECPDCGLTSPTLTEGDARALWDEWSSAEVSELLTAALAVNKAPRTVAFTAAGSASTNGSG